MKYETYVGLAHYGFFPVLAGIGGATFMAIANSGSGKSTGFLVGAAAGLLFAGLSEQHSVLRGDIDEGLVTLKKLDKRK